ncbi:MAG: formylglycine-generating enzyme family protein [Fibrobacterales bacterium]
MKALLFIIIPALFVGCILESNNYTQPYHISHELPNGEQLDSMVVTYYVDGALTNSEVHCNEDMVSQSEGTTCNFYDVRYDETIQKNELVLTIDGNARSQYDIRYATYTRKMNVTNGGVSLTGKGSILKECEPNTLTVDLIRLFPGQGVITYEAVKNRITDRVVTSVDIDSVQGYLDLYTQYLESNPEYDLEGDLYALGRTLFDSLFVYAHDNSDIMDEYEGIFDQLGIANRDSLLQQLFFNGTYSYAFYLDQQENAYLNGMHDPYSVGPVAMRSLAMSRFADEPPEEGVLQLINDAFYIGSYEVTHKEYAALMGGGLIPGTERLPKTSFTLKEMMLYCNARSESEGLTPVYRNIEGGSLSMIRANGYRLPTSDEWKAAYIYGYTEDEVVAYFWGSSDAEEVVRKYVNSTGQLSGVGSYLKPSVGRLYDLIGNAAEVVLDLNGTLQIAGGSYLDTSAPYGDDLFASWSFEESAADVGLRVVRTR